MSHLTGLTVRRKDNKALCKILSVHKDQSRQRRKNDIVYVKDITANAKYYTVETMLTTANNMPLKDYKKKLEEQGMPNTGPLKAGERIRIKKETVNDYHIDKLYKSQNMYARSGVIISQNNNLYRIKFPGIKKEKWLHASQIEKFTQKKDE